MKSISCPAWRPSFLSRSNRRSPAFALVIVLVILSLLAVITVGYLASMTQERATAGAFGSKAQAEQAALAAVESASGMLRDNFQAFPDSVTAWDTQLSDNKDNTYTEGTSLYLRAVPKANSTGDVLPDPAPGTTDPGFKSDSNFAGGNNPNNVNTSGVDQRKIFVLPLVSGATAKPFESKGNALPSYSDDKFVNINGRRNVGDTQGWLGTSPSYVDSNVGHVPAYPKPVKVPWVEIKQRDGITDPAQAPVIARYAFWVEDESFRANISQGGLGTNHQRRDNSQNYLLNASDLDLLGILKFIGDFDPASTALNLLTTRQYYPGQTFPESQAFAHTSGLTTDVVNKLRYLTTSQSSALNLTRHGSQRLNLNAVVPANTAPTDNVAIQKQVDTIVRTIQYHAPNFGQRFYRTAPGSGIVTAPGVLNAMTVNHPIDSDTTTSNHAKIYDYKVAANIRDYMDNDTIPTMVWDTLVGTKHTGVVRAPTTPAIPFGDNGDNAVWAIGKDTAPFLQECAVRYKRTDGGSGSPFEIAIDYYIEFWNMSNKDVAGSDLGPNPFIRVSNPTRWEVNNSASVAATATSAAIPAWSTGRDLISDDADRVSPSDTRPTTTSRDYKIDISNARFPAGQVTLITTDPDWSAVLKNPDVNAHVTVCPFSIGKRRYKGHFPPNRPPLGNDVLNMVFDTNAAYGSATSSSDYETDITVGSDHGYIDCLQGALPISWGGRISIPYTGSSANFPLFFGGMMRGNWTSTGSAPTEGMQSSALGDPRTNNEQLIYSLNSGTTVDRSRYNVYEVIAGGNATNVSTTSPATGLVQTLGQPNYRSFRPNRPENPWPDFLPYYFSPSTQSPGMVTPFAADTAPSVFPSSPSSSGGVLTSIGQLGEIYDPARWNDGGSIGGSRGGGRSFKVGQHDDRWDGDQTSASRGWAAWRLADIFCTNNDMQQSGLININGVTRDGGAAIQAALTGFKFQVDSMANPLGDPVLQDGASGVSRLQVDKLIAQLKTRLVLPSAVTGTGYRQTGAGPFWERGELSELPGFGRSPDQIKPDRSQGPTLYPTNPAPNDYQQMDITGVDMSSKVFPRGRNELFRRLVEMVTTRGNVFTVYAIGQAIQTSPNDLTKKRVAATHQMKVTFRLVPKQISSTGTGAAVYFHPGTDDNSVPLDFNPNSPNELVKRFAKPEYYDVQILSVSSGNA